jgi:hypothetical protein
VDQSKKEQTHQTTYTGKMNNCRASLLLSSELFSKRTHFRKENIIAVIFKI